MRASARRRSRIERYRYLLSQGVSGLSVAFDLPTQIGYDSRSSARRRRSRPRRRGHRFDRRHGGAVRRHPARPGVDVDDDQRHGDHPAGAVRRRRQAPGRGAASSCRGPFRTTSSRSTSRAAPISTRRRPRCASSPTSSRSASTRCRSGTRSRSAAITSAKRARRRCRRWRSRSPTPSPTCRRRVDAGLDVNSFGQRLSFFFNAHNDFLEEVAKFRAARRLWARLMRDRFGATNPRAQQLRFHTQTAGSTLTAQQPDNNIVRVALQALAAVLGRHAVAAHQRPRRGAGAADRGRRAHRAAHAADHRASNPASPTPSIRSRARTTSSS